MKKKIYSLLILLTILLSLFGCNSSNIKSVKVETINTKNIFDKKEIDENIDVSNAKPIEESMNISSSGEYKVSGELTGTINIEASNKDEITLVLDNATITTDSFASIYVKNADKVYIYLNGENSIINNNEFTQIDDNNVDGSIYSKCDLSIIGNGSLNITTKEHGIVAKDDLVITNVTLNIESEKRGIDANDSLSTLNSNININAFTDGIHVENEDDASKGNIYLKDTNIIIESQRDAISSSNILEIVGGTINIKTNSAYTISQVSMKGLKATNNIILNPSQLVINSKDDSIHSNDNIVISGGTYDLTSNDDGVHADTKLIINDCEMVIKKSYEGLESNEIIINGGNIEINASDDGINAAGGNDQSAFGGRPGMNNFNTSSNASIEINGGTIVVKASGDGIDSNNTITMTGGNVLIYGPTDNGNGAIDYESSFKITGGILCAIGSSGMAQNVSEGTQGSILYNMSKSLSSGVTIKLMLNNEVIYETESIKSFNSVVISTPEITKGNAYSLVIGSDTYSINMSNLIYSNSSSYGPGGQTGPGGQGGGPGGRR